MNTKSASREIFLSGLIIIALALKGAINLPPAVVIILGGQRKSTGVTSKDNNGQVVPFDRRTSNYFYRHARVRMKCRQNNPAGSKRYFTKWK